MKEGSEGITARKQEKKTQAQTVLNLGLDQINKFVYRLDGPLGEGNV
jgi:ribosomal protein L30/L7E